MSMTRINSRQKGKRVERLAANYLRSMGFNARRGQQYHGGLDSPDVVVSDLPGVHIEVKGNASMDIGTVLLDQAISQSDRDAPMDAEPVVLWKPLRKGWRLTWIERGIQCTTTGDAEIATTLRRLNESMNRIDESNDGLHESNNRIG